jgi:hypothetical protein
VVGLKSFLQQWPNAWRWLACLFAGAVFTWSLAFFYLPGQGFTYLIQFGDVHHERYLPELKAANHYEMPKSIGYDSQWYAQIAMRPHLGDPALKTAVDGLAYRARRILFPIVAWLLAGGNAVRAMNIYSLENVVSWYLLALLLFRWFPPVSWGNVGRWAAVLFSFGLVFSVTRALLDGPSLLLVAVGIALVESRRPWLAAVVLAVTGLGKDTNILCGSALPLPASRDGRAWAVAIGRVALVLLPLVIWMYWVRRWVGPGDDIGTRNFAAPFAGLIRKLENIASLLAAGGRAREVARHDLYVLVGALAQFLFFAFRRRWRDPWWRVGASYAVLMVFLGDAVWENYPSAAARVLLPMTLAFNVLVPKGRGWALLLVLGNLGIVSSADISKPPGRESFAVTGSSELRVNPADGTAVEAVFGPRNWWVPEKNRWEFWRWALGDATVTLHNPQPFTLVSTVTFALRSVDAREAIVERGGQVTWRGMLQPAQVLPVSLGEIELPPGDTVLTFRSDRPPAAPANGDLRTLTFSVRRLKIDLERRR